MDPADSNQVLDAPLDRPRDEGEDRTNLIINYLPQNMTDNEMYSMFITCGPLVSAKIMRDKTSGYSFGYGFVQYQNPDDASKAITQLNGLPVSNKRIKVSYSRPNTADIRNTNLYVGNVPPEISDDELVNLFTPYGTIITKNILKDHSTGKNKGIAFVRFSKKSEADYAISQLNGYTLPGCSIGLDVKVAEDHGKQKAAFYAGMSVAHGAHGSEADGDYGTNAWGGGGRGRGRGRGGPQSIASNMAAQGYGYGFGAMQHGGGAPQGSRYNPVSRGGQKGGYNNPRGGWGGGFNRGGGRGGGNYGDDNVAWN